MLLSLKMRWEDFLNPWSWKGVQSGGQTLKGRETKWGGISGRRAKTDQLAARQLLQEGHEHVSILDVLEKVLHLDGRLALRDGRKGRVRASTEPTGARVKERPQGGLEPMTFWSGGSAGLKCC